MKKGIERFGRDLKYYRQMKKVGMLFGSVSIYRSISVSIYHSAIGIIKEIDNQNLTCTVSFFPDNRNVSYQKEDIVELELAYAVTIHKSQGSEFEIVIIPVLTQHFKMLFRNLIYTGLTRARKFAFFVGTRKALAMAVKNQDTSQRQTALKELITSDKVQI